MLPVCDNCFADDHEQCDQRGHLRDIVCGCACETATTARSMIRVDMQTEKSVEPLPLVARAHRALDEMDSIVEVEVDYEYHDEVRDSYGRVVHGTVRSILRITGEVH